jgi:hypothetical protein
MASQCYIITVMRTWPLLLRIIGSLNLGLALFGCYAEAIPALSMLRNPPHFNPQEPFFPAAFWIQVAISAVLLVAFIIVSIMLLTLRRGAATAHTCFMALLIVYVFVHGVLWLLPGGVGASIAGATGVANFGTAILLFWPVPYLYPLVSTACVNIAQKRIKKMGQDADSVEQYL